MSLAVSLFCLRMGRRRRRSSFSSLTLATVPRGLDVRTETTGVSFGTLSVCLPLKHCPTFLSTRAFLIPFPLHRSGLRSFEFSSPDKYEVLQLSSICDSSVPWFAPFLDRTMPSQSEDEQNLPIWSCTILPGSYLTAIHSQTMKRDPI